MAIHLADFTRLKYDGLGKVSWGKAHYDRSSGRGARYSAGPRF